MSSGWKMIKLGFLAAAPVIRRQRRTVVKNNVILGGDWIMIEEGLF